MEARGSFAGKIAYLRALLERSLQDLVTDGSYSAPIGVDGAGKRMMPILCGVALAIFGEGASAVTSS